MTFLRLSFCNEFYAQGRQRAQRFSLNKVFLCVLCGKALVLKQGPS
jgi:hypothetical protein